MEFKETARFTMRNIKRGLNYLYNLGSVLSLLSFDVELRMHSLVIHSCTKTTMKNILINEDRLSFFHSPKNLIFLFNNYNINITVVQYSCLALTIINSLTINDYFCHNVYNVIMFKLVYVRS